MQLAVSEEENKKPAQKDRNVYLLHKMPTRLGVAPRRLPTFMNAQLPWFLVNVQHLHVAFMAGQISNGSLLFKDRALRMAQSNGLATCVSGDDDGKGRTVKCAVDVDS